MLKSLKPLLKDIKVVKVFGELDIKVSGIIDDSRKVKKGFVFVAIKGFNVDGHNFIDQALNLGAVAVIGEKEYKSGPNRYTYIQVKNSRESLAIIASAWNDYPSKKLKLIGVTGTDGKTTTCNLIYSFFSSADKNISLISTINAKVGKSNIDTGFHVTNPEPLVLQELLAKMVKIKSVYACLEVTSQGIDQNRISGINFDLAVLTNITHDHLDYHKTWEEYRDTKLKFIKSARVVVLNKDDPSFGYIKEELLNSTRLISHSLKDNNSDYYAKDILEGEKYTDFKLKSKGETVSLRTRLMGRYNISNILGAIACARYYKTPMRVIKLSLLKFKAPKGRLEEVKNNRGIKVYVDFAHTPNALEQVLKIFKPKTKGRLISVFGCTGERDVFKRPLMGEISTKIADISIFTADDIRGENLDIIISQIVSGAMKNKTREITKRTAIPKVLKEKVFVRIPDRGEAIFYAINKFANKGDIVVLCGKGHENSLLYKGVELPWSDRKAARMSLIGKYLRLFQS